MSSSAAGIDLDGQEGAMMSGVFRWKASHALRSLPPPSDHNKPADFSKGWMELFASKCSTGAEVNKLVAYVQHDLSLIDCMSFPASVLSALFRSGLLPTPLATAPNAPAAPMMQELHICCMGCSSKAEERILRETRCWHELGTGTCRLLPHIYIYARVNRF